MVIELPLKRLISTLGLGIGVLVTAGAAVSTLRIFFHHDYLMGLGPLLDLNGERNLPTWFSSALLLVTSGVLAGLARGTGEPFRQGWILLAGVFLFLSLDEAVGLHEMANAPLRALLRVGPALYFPWLLAGGTFAAAVLWSQRAVLARLPRETRNLFLLAGGVYLAGAMGLEALAAPVYAASGQGTLRHAALVLGEETLEMAGSALFLVALLRYAGVRHGPVVVMFNDRERDPAALLCMPRRVTLGLVWLACALALVSLAAQAVQFVGGVPIPAIVRLVHLSREGNIPTWFQSSTLLVCGAISAVIAAAAFARREAFSRHWAATALFCVYLSADEASAIHELSVRPLRSALGASGIIYYPWVLIGALVVLAIAITSRRFFGALPAATRRALVTGAAVFLTGALGVEALGGMYAEQEGRQNLGYGLITTVEETCEMLGVAIVIGGLLAHLRDHVGTVRLTARVSAAGDRG